VLRTGLIDNLSECEATRRNWDLEYVAYSGPDRFQGITDIIRFRTSREPACGSNCRRRVTGS